MASSSHLNLFVYTGNRKNAGTNSSVHIILHSDDGKASKPITLNNVFSNDFERDQIDTFRVSDDNIEELGRSANVERIELWKDKTLGLISDDWYVNRIVVQNTATNTDHVFPLFRWIKSDYHYNFKCLDTSLPQFEEFPEQRKKELDEKRQAYVLAQKKGGDKGPVQVNVVPPDEQFSFDYKWGIVSGGLYMKVAGAFASIGRKKWTSIADIDNMYSGLYKKPQNADRLDSDVEFGRQRLAGVNPTIISLMKAVPDKFPITDDLLGPLLEEMSIQRAISKKKLFLCDLSFLEGAPTKGKAVLCAPFALCFINKEKQLVPIAIQLFPEPGPENPIFTPQDDPMLWRVVKMWFNNADSAYHQSVTHLGMTHLLMEGIAVVTHRNISTSHPIMKLLEPHFLYIIAINSKGLEVLISEGGWVDKTMSIGVQGMMALITKRFDNWRMDVDGTLPQDLKARGLDDQDVLPGYHYRDDALLLYNAIKKYVRSYVDLYYTSEDLIQGDLELQSWAEELVMDRQKIGGGVGLKGVPGNGSLASSQDLVDILTSIIFTCSVSHASANFGQYDEYAHPLKYPTFLRGSPPTSKDVQITEKELLEIIPTQSVLEGILQVTTTLSKKGTFSLGDFEIQYIFDPKARILVDRFREDLKSITDKITARNQTLEIPYEYLLPERIPNSIGI